MILINTACVLYQKLYYTKPLDDTSMHDWMREVDINDHIANDSDLKEWGRQMIREILDETCILFLQGVKEECEKEIKRHDDRVK